MVFGATEAVLKSDLGDDFHAPAVGLHLVKRAVDVPPANAAGAEDLVQPLDDGRTVRGSRQP